MKLSKLARWNALVSSIIDVWRSAGHSVSSGGRSPNVIRGGFETASSRIARSEYFHDAVIPDEARIILSMLSVRGCDRG